MNFKQLNPTSVVHSLATLLLLATMSLFGYEFSKPNFNAEAHSAIVWKMSPFSPQALAKEQIYPLPALPERFQRKVLVYGVTFRTVTFRPSPVDQRGKNFVPADVTRKAYMAMNQPVSAVDDNNQ